LCWHLACGFSQAEAAKKSGLPDTYRLAQFSRTRAFADELQTALRDYMGTQLAPKAVRILNEIMSDGKVQARVRVDAAKALLDRAGHGVSETQKRSSIDPEEMASWSEEELRKFISTAQGELQEAADRRFRGARLIENNSDLGVLG
jgi:hypothetical protein